MAVSLRCQPPAGLYELAFICVPVYIFPYFFEVIVFFKSFVASKSQAVYKYFFFVHKTLWQGIGVVLAWFILL